MMLSIERSLRRRSRMTSLLTKRRFLKRKKKLTRSLKKWNPYAKSKRMRGDKESRKIRKLQKQNKLRSKRKWTWILLLNMFRESGTGSKPKESSLQKKERRVRVVKRRKRSEEGCQSISTLLYL